jgi:hypothetical protein
MPTESNRDDLARIIFTAHRKAFSQTWEQTSEGWHPVVPGQGRRRDGGGLAEISDQWQWAMLDMALDFAISG